MDDLRTMLLVGLIVLLAMCMEGITGFGSGVLAIPFLSMLMGIKSAVLFMSMMSMALCLMIVCRYARLADKRVLLTVLVISGIGFPIGILLYDYLPETFLRIILGSFVLAFAIKSLYSYFWACVHEDLKEHSGKTWIQYLALLFGGVCHGMFASGGPMMVVYTSSQKLEKQVFRATMSSVWVFFNTAILLKNILAGGIITGSFLKGWLFAVPFMFIGGLVGNKLHFKVNMKVFLLIMYLLLFIAGASSIVTAVIDI